MTCNDRVIIFNAALRDSEQSLGASMVCEEKLRIAKTPERLEGQVDANAHPQVAGV